MCVAAACARVLAVRLCLPRAHSVPHGQVMVTKDKAQKGKVRGRVSRGAPGRARSPGAALCTAWRDRGKGLTRGGAGGHDLEIEASSQPFNVPAPNTLSS